MAYSEFRLPDVKARLGLTVVENLSLFPSGSVPPAEVSDYLRLTLEEFRPLALAINTEKARSEWIIAPVLAEVRRLLLPDASLFSGVTFNVEASQGLEGVCDYLLSRSPEQFYVAAPVVAVVEAKREDIVGGLGQCLATLYAAHLFNERSAESPRRATVHGAVTTGTAWRFVRLRDRTAWIDRDEYYLQSSEDAARVVGLLLHMVRGGGDEGGKDAPAAA